MIDEKSFELRRELLVSLKEALLVSMREFFDKEIWNLDSKWAQESVAGDEYFKGLSEAIVKNIDHDKVITPLVPLGLSCKEYRYKSFCNDSLEEVPPMPGLIEVIDEKGIDYYNDWIRKGYEGPLAKEVTTEYVQMVRDLTEYIQREMVPENK